MDAKELDTTYTTIVSLLPYDLVESKPGLNPNEFIIKKADDEMGLTIIPNDVHYLINTDPLSDAKDVRLLKVPVPSMELAQSIINDYNNALLGAEPDSQPGLFAVKGNYTDKRVIKLKFANQLIVARDCQLRWYHKLVDIADDLWSKTHSPISISDIQRTACKALGFQRDWLNATPTELQEKCPVCKNAVNNGALKCIACGHILNKIEYEKLLGIAK